MNGRKLYGTSSSRERRDHARRQTRKIAIAQLSKELGINPKTVAKWRKRATVEDLMNRPGFTGGLFVHISGDHIE